MADATLQRLFQLGGSIPSSALRSEHKELVLKLAGELNVTLEEPVEDSVSETTTKKSPRDEISSNGASSARERFQKQEKQVSEDAQKQNTIRREARKSSVKSPTLPSNGTGNSDCDISSPAIKEAYDKVRDDSDTLNWISLGYGASKKVLELYGSGEGGLKEFTQSLKDDEVTYGYVRVIFGDSARSKFVFVTYVPEGLSILTKAKANTHKPAVTQYLKYMHTDVFANSKAELAEDLIQSKLKAAAGANYGTGGTAAAGTEDFGSIKDNAKNFFQQTEGKGSKQSIVYDKGPLSNTTPVSLQGRAGITDKYIKDLEAKA